MKTLQVDKNEKQVFTVFYQQKMIVEKITKKASKSMLQKKIYKKEFLHEIRESDLKTI